MWRLCATRCVWLMPWLLHRTRACNSSNATTDAVVTLSDKIEVCARPVLSIPRCKLKSKWVSDRLPFLMHAAYS